MTTDAASTQSQAEALRALSQSVTGKPPAMATMAPAGANFLLWFMAQRADGFTPWGASPKQRDWELRAFWPSENMLASTVATVSARNAALSWKITGDEQTAIAAQALCNNANFGGGWEEFVTQTSIDLYTQDSGAFVELIRESDSPAAPVIGIAHLDAARCYPTGNPLWPVIYEGSDGVLRRMPWYTVVQLLEMAAPITPTFTGFFFKLQYSAVTRVLRAAQVMKSIAVYKDEKVSGRFLRALHLVSGVDEAVVQDAIRKAQFFADQSGASRYMQPAIVGTVDPQAPIKHDTIEMSSLPDGWSEEESIKSYLIALSMGFLTDYQELAPLPGGNLGTSAQSETLHKKSRGKGPGLFQKLILRLMNGNGVLPSNVRFEFDEMDIDEDKANAEARNMRITGRASAIQSGEIDVIAARQQALEVGDITQAQYDELIQRDEQRAEEEQRRLSAQMEAAAQRRTPAVVEEEGTEPDGNTTVEGEDGESMGVRAASVAAREDDDVLLMEDVLFGERETAAVAEERNPQRGDVSSPIDEERLAYEAEVGDDIGRTLGRARRAVLSHLNGGDDGGA